MSNKFEIIKNKWIVKHQRQGTNDYEIAIKIDAITELTIHYGQGPSSIRLYGADKKEGSFQLSYDKKEKKLFEKDVKRLKAVIYK